MRFWHLLTIFRYSLFLRDLVNSDSGKDVYYCLFVSCRLLSSPSWMTLSFISYPFSLLIRSLIVLIFSFLRAFVSLWFQRIADAWCVFRKRCIDIFVSLSSAFPVSRWSAFWFFWFFSVWSLVLHDPSTLHRNFVVFDSLSYVDRMDRPRRWILLYLEYLELLIDIFLHFDTRPHHNVQIVNFYMWHILFVDFFDLRTSQLLIFKFVDCKYPEVAIYWDLVVPLSWICKSRDCWNPSSFFFHFSLCHFQTSCSDMSVRIWCYVQQEHPAADHLNAVMSAVLRDKVCWASGWHRRGPMAKPVLPSRGGVRHLSKCVKLSTVESLC